MQAVYSDRYQIDLGLHVFPTAKYRLIAERLSQRPDITFVEPEPATWAQLALVHTAEYLAKMRDGTLGETEVEQLELPWSAGMVDGFRLMVGGTIYAALAACDLQDDQTQSAQSTQRRRFSASSAGSAFNVVAHIGGGLHHASGLGDRHDTGLDIFVLVRFVDRIGWRRVKT